APINAKTSALDPTERLQKRDSCRPAPVEADELASAVKSESDDLIVLINRLTSRVTATRDRCDLPHSAAFTPDEGHKAADDGSAGGPSYMLQVVDGGAHAMDSPR